MSITFPPLQFSPLTSSKTEVKKKIKKAQNSDAFTLEASQELDSVSLQTTNQSRCIGGLTSLFLEQYPPASTEKTVIQRGHLLLDELEILRLSLLTGTVSASRLAAIQELLTHQKENCQDENLKNIIDEINIRAAVELAKLTYVK